ncbi:cell surface glycoprotein 1-like [Cotesia glomerata]|uniref:cell surface glycoprotein 1-like n=1 Tax=Cotesia glomerata TaxID=32391 RepID=UPI001D007CAC|nr:cell surface glycoprotein 1-like [Cotesia glomerata]
MITQGRDKKTIVLRPGESIWRWKTTLILASLIYGGDYATGQGNNFKCREEGYQADPRECQVYYRCVSWGSSGPLTTFKFECGPGTVFSHSKGNICVHPRDSERSECSEMGNDVNSVYQPQHRPQYSSSRPTQHYPSSSTASGPQHRPQYPTSSSPSRPQYPSSSRPTRPHHPQYPSTPSRPRPQHPSTPTSRPQYIPPPTESPHANEINPEGGPRPGSNRPATGGQSQCQSEGFMAHPQDCKKFIRCVNDGFGSYSTYEFTCGEGTIWDSTIEGCNHAWAVKSSCGSSGASPGSSHSDGNLPEPGHPSQGSNSNQPGSDSSDPESDYPSQGKEPDQNQDPGTEQDSNGSEEPSTPDEANPNVPSQGAGYPDQDSNYPDNDNPNEGSPDQESNPSVPSGDSGYPGQNSPGQDPDNPNEPDEDSGYPDSRPSSPYPLYPPGPEPPLATTESLDASTVRQPLATRPPSSAASPAEPNLPESEGPQAETTNKPGAGSGSGDCNEEGFFPDPKDCHKFFRCVKADSTFTKYEFECGESTAWDPSVQTCNYEYAVSNCKNPGSSGQTTPSSAPTETSSKDEEPDSDKDQSSSPPSVESSTEEDKQFSPSSTDSSDTSSDETPTTSTTSASASSNPEDPSTPSSSTEESSPPDSNETSPESSPEEKPTSSTTKEPTESEAPKPTTEDTPSTAASAGADKKPSGPGMSGSSCKDEGFFPNPSDCRKFFRCVKGDNGLIKYDFDCAPGTAWEQSLLTCNYIHLVASCGSETNQVSSPEADSNKDKDKDGDKEKDEGKPTSEPTEKPKDEGEGSSSPDSTTEGSNKPTDSSNGSNKPSQVSPSGDSDPNKGIVCNSAGFYGHPTKCDKFYRCVDNGNGFNVYHFDCAPGTIFDPSLSLCNYPESVYPARDCSGSSASPPSSSTESSQEPSTTPSGEATTESSESTDAPGTGEMTTSRVESTTAASGTESPEDEGTTTGAPAESTEEGVTGSEMTTEGSQDQTTVASTESPEQTTEMEMTTESGAETTTAAGETSEPESTTPAKAEGETGFVAPCPIVGNLTDEQIVLVCPTGFRRHPKYCNMFYQCMSEGNMEIKILVLACPDKTIFDEKKIQCVEESESSQVCDTEMASARLYRQLEHTSKAPMKVKRESLCPDEGHYPFQQGCSNAFYKCKRDSRKALQGYLYKCPKEYVYWSVSRRCERQSRLPTCSHIKYEDNERIHSVENRWELPIEDRNLSARMLAF